MGTRQLLHRRRRTQHNSAVVLTHHVSISPDIRNKERRGSRAKSALASPLHAHPGFRDAFPLIPSPVTPVPRTQDALPHTPNLVKLVNTTARSPYPRAEESRGSRVKGALLTPFRKLLWSSLERHIAKRMKLKKALKPEMGFVEDVFFGGQVGHACFNFQCINC